MATLNGKSRNKNLELKGDSFCSTAIVEIGFQILTPSLGHHDPLALTS